MDTQDFLLEEYRTLRVEIAAIKSRLFKIVAFGSVAVPVLTFLGEMPDTRVVSLILPFVVLVLTILFVADQQELMRCGRFIRERIEPRFEKGAGWESWLESQTDLRVLDKCLFGCFVITFFVFYFVSSGMAIEKLWTSGDFRISGANSAIVGGVAYGIGVLWMFFTLIHHWRSATSTSQ
ncbi:MAG: hypothetical protein V3W34_05530 [Phycisphaerae bacterium]